jgi:hypothetical protein
MERLRRNRRAVGGLAVIGALTVVVTFVVVPALASAPGANVPPPSATLNVMPTDVATGGQSNDCQVFYASNPSSLPPYQFRISNPKTGTYSTTVGSTTVQFKLTMNPPDQGSTVSPAYANDKYVNFSVLTAGTKVIDVGIKGGTDTTRYNYSGQPLGYAPVADPADKYLHAPAQSVDANNNPTQLYSVSNLTFCFDLGGAVTGNVYLDANQNGANDAGDAAQSGWTVRLYSASTLVTTTTSLADGSYRLKAVLDPSKTYRVCEAPPSGTWAQSEPLPSSPNICSGTGELKKGYSFTPTSATQIVPGNDFGNVPAVTCPPNNPGVTSSSLDTSYQIQLASCKAGQTFVFNTTNGVYADADSGTTPPTVSVWVGDQTLSPQVPIVEKIVLPFRTTNPPIAPVVHVTLYYTDTFPFVAASAVPMPFCLLDPRDGTDMGLQPSYATLPLGTGVAPVIPSGATSCLIRATEEAPPNPVARPNIGRYTAYVYSELDGLRFGGP